MDRAVKCGACNVVNKKVNVNATQFKCSTCGTMNAISPQARAAAQKKARNIVMVIGVVIGAIVIWSLVSGGSSKGFTASVVGSPSASRVNANSRSRCIRRIYRTLRRQPNAR